MRIRLKKKTWQGAIRRFFVRTWFGNRNIELGRQLKALRKALRQIEDDWARLPGRVREEYIRRDPLMRHAKGFYEATRVFFEEGI